MIWCTCIRHIMHATFLGGTLCEYYIAQPSVSLVIMTTGMQGTRAICSLDLHPKTLAKARTDVLGLWGGLKQFKFSSNFKSSQHPASQKGTSYTVLLQSGSIEEPRVAWYWMYGFGSLEVSVANSIPTKGAIQGSTPETMGRIAMNYYQIPGSFSFWDTCLLTTITKTQTKHMDVLQSITGNETGHERKRWEPFQVWYAPDASASSIFVPFFASALSGADGKQPALQFMSWPVVILFR